MKKIILGLVTLLSLCLLCAGITGAVEEATLDSSQTVIANNDGCDNGHNAITSSSQGLVVKSATENSVVGNNKASVSGDNLEISSSQSAASTQKGSVKEDAELSNNFAAEIKSGKVAQETSATQAGAPDARAVTQNFMEVTADRGIAGIQKAHINSNAAGHVAIDGSNCAILKTRRGTASLDQGLTQISDPNSIIAGASNYGSVTSKYGGVKVNQTTTQWLGATKTILSHGANEADTLARRDTIINQSHKTYDKLWLDGTDNEINFGLYNGVKAKTGDDLTVHQNAFGTAVTGPKASAKLEGYNKLTGIWGKDLEHEERLKLSKDIT